MDRRILVAAVLLAALVLLASCSVVFEAGISGKVVTASGTSTAGVQDVSVFAYTDKGLRDSDFVKFARGEITRPTEGSGYVATTTTNANGEFTVNKIVWETKMSEFGKTADVSRLYLIFYHEDYIPAQTDATIISGSTNSSNVYVELEGSKDYTVINVNVTDVGSGNTMASAATLEYWVNKETTEDPDVIVLTGSTTFRISYPKGTTAEVSMSLYSPGTYWQSTDMDGKAIYGPLTYTMESGVRTINLYMRNDEIVLPAFSGDIDGTIDSDHFNGNDNLPVRLSYRDTDGNWVYFTEVDESQTKTYSNRLSVGDLVYFTHGQFSGVGNTADYTITINEDTYPSIIDWASFDGKTISLRLRLEFGTLRYEFDYTPRTNATLGHIVTV